MSDLDFAGLGLDSGFLDTIRELGYETPSTIQAKAIPVLLQGGDLLGVAQTGTGKTAAFTLPLLQRLDFNLREPQILVLAPTRELGMQVAASFEKYAKHQKDFKCVCVYGGQDIRLQVKSLRNKPHVIVATPGRLIDHLNRNNINFDGLKAIVLDEADEMLNMGFQEDVENILGQAPEGVQMALFSATMPRGILHVANTYLKNPTRIEIDQQVKTVDNIDQRYLLVSRHNKLKVLERVIEVEEVDAGIIFVKTRQQTIEVAESMEKAGFRVAPMNGDLQQSMREATVRQLKEGHLDWVVATDVAARGLDVPRITHVINYEIPFDNESYVHRIGRTGRAGRKGVAILLLSGSEMRQLRRIESHTGAGITEMPLPNGKDISDRRIEAFKTRLLKVMGTEDLKRVRKLVEKLQEDHDLDMQVLAASLMIMATETRPLFPKLDVIPEEKARGGGRDGGRDGGAFGRDGGRERGAGGRERGARNSPPADGLQRYRLSVGRQHNIGAGDIVGAIANEGGIPSANIGNISLFQNYSTVDLPKNIPASALEDLSRIRIRNVESQMRIYHDDPADGGVPAYSRDKKRPDSSTGSRERKKSNYDAPRERSSGGYEGSRERSSGGYEGSRERSSGGYEGSKDRVKSNYAGSKDGNFSRSRTGPFPKKAAGSFSRKTPRG
jgi:ATP-dependent RNA helicase DeaD